MVLTQIHFFLISHVREAYFEGVRNVFGFYLIAVFFGCHSDKLLGSFGNVICALDDLLSDQLDV